MKKLICVILSLFLYLSAAFSLDYSIIYMEGFPYTRGTGGSEEDLFIGGTVRTGDTIITETGDTVELESGEFRLKVSENSVFTIIEKEANGELRVVLALFLGKFVFSVNKFAGNEPDLITNSAVMGVRGTRVALLAGADGTSLIIVEEGIVEVQAGGDSIALGMGEGVEVETGSGPGEKFTALESEIDYGAWNQDRLDTMVTDPVRSAINVEQKMLEYVTQIQAIYPLYLEKKRELDEHRAVMSSMKEKGEDTSSYYQENARSLEIESTFLIINIRYYALSALSLRRYVLGRMYLILKSMYITDLTNPVYIEFLEIKENILDVYEKEVVESFIVQADI